jgi:hypothetical protein
MRDGVEWSELAAFVRRAAEEKVGRVDVALAVVVHEQQLRERMVRVRGAELVRTVLPFELDIEEAIGPRLSKLAPSEMSLGWRPASGNMSALVGTPGANTRVVLVALTYSYPMTNMYVIKYCMHLMKKTIAWIEQRGFSG